MNPSMNVPQGIIQQQSPQQNMPPNMQQMVPPPQNANIPPAHTDNISKVKSLLGPLKESLKNIFQSAAMLLNQDTTGNVKNELPSNARFDKYLEEFYSICDQIELHLVTAKKCIQQANASQVYLPVPVVPRNENIAQENALTYTQYLELVKTQITYAKEIHDTLLMAAQNI
ncbi:hypothetical protein PVAND_014730 [Polypedilum vanderplanki]|uniref:Mediator of RNA polymerase II transcription subunit 29 n=1 Tax=Polypedilum vanderplanki TaxID=319348 RepID=A0A9J6BA74_POLVA|nr:hypothetical protein PVAND_014730 [Polypedilum vanderplanki]